MTEDLLAKLFEHNNWANLKIIDACSALSDEQLDAEPRSATRGTIRRTLLHLVDSQQNYLAQLTGVAPRFRWRVSPPLSELQEAAIASGEGLLALARGIPEQSPQTRLQTDDGYWVEPWVLMVQVIQHATEHREQINSMLSALGLTPLVLDGWTYGEVTKALVPDPSRKALLLDQLRRGRQEREAWVTRLSAAERAEEGSAERWSARDYVAHIGFWQGYWAGRLAAARRGEQLPEDVAGPNAEGPDNAQVFEEHHRLSWPEALDRADRAYQAMLAQAEALTADELFSPQYSPAVRMETAARRFGIAGCWHIFEHETQFYTERGNPARATEIQEVSAGERIRLAAAPRDRGIGLYNLACFYATTRRPQEALARLPEALRLAPDLAQFAQEDSDLATLRDQPAYQALFEERPPQRS